MPHRLPYLVCLLVMLLSLPLVLVEKVIAAARLRRSSPAAGETLQRPPREVWMWFTEPLSADSKIQVFDHAFRSVVIGSASIDPADVSLLRVPLEKLAPGRYTVRWQAVNRLGMGNEGSFDFTVQAQPVVIPNMVWWGVAGIAVCGMLALFAGLLWGKRRNRQL